VRLVVVTTSRSPFDGVAECREASESANPQKLGKKVFLRPRNVKKITRNPRAASATNRSNLQPPRAESCIKP
jgi:hypothetical protein